MTASDWGRRGTNLRSRVDPTFRWGVVLAGALLLLLPLASTTSAATAWDPAPKEWSNGVVLCEFMSSVPTVSVSALERAQTGLSATLGSVQEVNPSGQVVAIATASTANWSASNLSNDDEYDLSYSLLVPVTGPTPSAPSLGSAYLTVAYVLPAYQGSTNGSVDSVSVDVQVSAWPWQGVGDHLALTLQVWPSFTDEEHLVFGGPSADWLTSVSKSSGTALEQMDGSTSAIANPSSSNPTVIPASASVSGNASGAVVSVSFGSAAGAFSALNYSASVSVLFPSTIAGIPTVDLVAVGSVAALISVLVAAGVRTMRSRPSDLKYVDEEER